MSSLTATRIGATCGVLVLLGLWTVPIDGADGKKEEKADATKEKAESIFADKNLEAAVRRYVFEKKNNDEPIVAADVRDISTIEAKKKGIRDLSGLEHCRSLRLLDLEGNEVKDLTPLAGLELVQSLNVASNKLKDVAPLAKLKALQYLDLSGNDITDAAPLAGLMNLTTLYLSHNAVTDLKPLKKLSKLWSLYLDGNGIKDGQPLRHLKRLSTLSLRNNRVEDLSFLRNYTELRYLMLQSNRVQDIAVLVEAAKKDSEGNQRFAPFWRVYLSGNPLRGGGAGEIDALKELGGRVEFARARQF